MSVKLFTVRDLAKILVSMDQNLVVAIPTGDNEGPFTWPWDGLIDDGVWLEEHQVFTRDKSQFVSGKRCAVIGKVYDR